MKFLAINIAHCIFEIFIILRTFLLPYSGMFGGDKVWQIASLKVVGEKKVWRTPTAVLHGLTSEKVWMV